MSVLVEAVSVVVRRSTLADRFYLGGFDAYIEELRGAVPCWDDHLVSAIFLDPFAAEGWIRRLQLRRFQQFDDDGNAADIALFDQVRGLLAPCPWLDWLSWFEWDATVVRLHGEDDWNPIMLPSTWTPEQHRALCPIPISPPPPRYHYDRGNGTFLRTFRDGHREHDRVERWDGARWEAIEVGPRFLDEDVRTIDDWTAASHGVEIWRPGPDTEPIAYAYARRDEPE